MVMNEVLSFWMEELLCVIKLLVLSWINQCFTDIKLRTALVALCKRRVKDMEIDALFKITTKESHPKVLVYSPVIELRKGLVVIVE